MRRAVRRLHLRTLAEQLRTSLWFTPAVAVIAGGVVAAALSRITVTEQSAIARFVFPGGAQSARAVLQAVAGSVITVTGVVFSLTVVTLQLASTQFSPRLLRTFLRDLSNQIVLGTFLATFAYALVVLRAVRSGARPEDDVVPAVAVSGAYVLAAASVFALVYFIDHIARSIRIDSLMRDVNADTLHVLSYTRRSQERASVLREPPDPPACAVEVGAPRSGFVQAIDVDVIARAAERHDAHVKVEVVTGNRIVRNRTLAWCWRTDPREPAPELREVIADAVQIGFERTMQQDVGFGFRQLVDVAVKALSPGINDPTTAVHALGHLAALLCEIQAGDLGARAVRDAEGVERVFVPEACFEDYLQLSCRQIRRYGAGEPAVTTELLRLLLDVSRCDLSPEDRAAVLLEAEMTAQAAQRETADVRDLEELHRLYQQVRHAVV